VADPSPIISLLLHHGAEPRVRDSGGRTPLHNVYAHPTAVRALLEAGADPLTTDAHGVTPLHRCMEFMNEVEAQRCVASAIILLQHSPGLADQADAAGRSALDLLLGNDAYATLSTEDFAALWRLLMDDTA